MTKPAITGVLRFKGRDIDPSTELERLLAQSVSEKAVEELHSTKSERAKFARSTDIASDYTLREVHCELSLVITR